MVLCVVGSTISHPSRLSHLFVSSCVWGVCTRYLRWRLARAAAGTESDDRSVPSIDPALQPSHEFAKARRASLDAMEDFNGVAPLNEIGVQAMYGDRSAPAVCGEATIDTVTGGHASARRKSLDLIEKNSSGA